MEDKKVLQTKLVVEYEQLITKIEDLEGDLGYVSGNNLDDLNLLIEYKDRLENEINSFPGQKTPKKIIKSKEKPKTSGSSFNLDYILSLFGVLLLLNVFYSMSLTSIVGGFPSDIIDYILGSGSSTSYPQFISNLTSQRDTLPILFITGSSLCLVGAIISKNRQTYYDILIGLALLGFALNYSYDLVFSSSNNEFANELTASTLLLGSILSIIALSFLLESFKTEIRYEKLFLIFSALLTFYSAVTLLLYWVSFIPDNVEELVFQWPLITISLLISFSLYALTYLQKLISNLNLNFSVHKTLTLLGYVFLTNAFYTMTLYSIPGGFPQDIIQFFIGGSSTQISTLALIESLNTDSVLIIIVGELSLGPFLIIIGHFLNKDEKTSFTLLSMISFLGFSSLFNFNFYANRNPSFIEGAMFDYLIFYGAIFALSSILFFLEGLFLKTKLSKFFSFTTSFLIFAGSAQILLFATNNSNLNDLIYSWPYITICLFMATLNKTIASIRSLFQ